jgi:hypothetical protein
MTSDFSKKQQDEPNVLSPPVTTENAEKAGRFPKLEFELERIHNQRPSITSIPTTIVAGAALTTVMVQPDAVKTTPKTAAIPPATTSLSAPTGPTRKISRFTVEPSKVVADQSAVGNNSVPDSNKVTSSFQQQQQQQPQIGQPETVTSMPMANEEPKRELKLDLSPSANVMANNQMVNSMSPMTKMSSQSMFNPNLTMTGKFSLQLEAFCTMNFDSFGFKVLQNIAKFSMFLII